jgi:hypothetical protein
VSQTQQEALRDQTIQKLKLKKVLGNRGKLIDAIKSMNETQLQKISSFLKVKIDKTEEPKEDDGEVRSMRNSETEEINDQVEDLKEAMQEDRSEILSDT